MFQVLNPIWLFGIAGILIPVLIHLWNIKQGKTLKIGSVILLGESSKQNARSLRLQDLLLLLLRCLLIIILAFLLAQPVWTRPYDITQNKGWILTGRADFKEAYSRFKAEIDSLDRLGYEFHFFEPGFKLADIQYLAEDQSMADTSRVKLSYWSVARMLDHEIPKGFKAFIYTCNSLSRFKGERPLISNSINWKTYTSADSTATWIGRAYFTNRDSIRAIISTSGPAGTFHRIENIDPSDNNSPYTVNIKEGKAKLRFKTLPSQNDDDRQADIDTSTLRISIFTDKYQKDAAYLEAAIGAVQSYTARKLKLSRFSSGTIPEGQNLIIWLSEKQLSPAQLKKLPAGSSILAYEKGKTESLNSWIEESQVQRSVQKEPITLFRRIAYPEKPMMSTSIWEDGFGRPVLDLYRKDQVSVYRFFSRFNPEWSDLVWNTDFAEMLIPILLPHERVKEIDEYDRRTADHLQILPGKAGSESKKVLLGSDEQMDLKDYFWLALIIVFICERWLSYRQDQI